MRNECKYIILLHCCNSMFSFRLLRIENNLVSQYICLHLTLFIYIIMFVVMNCYNKNIEAFFDSLAKFNIIWIHLLFSIHNCSNMKYTSNICTSVCLQARDLPQCRFYKRSHYLLPFCCVTETH